MPAHPVVTRRLGPALRAGAAGVALLLGLVFAQHAGATEVQTVGSSFSIETGTDLGHSHCDSAVDARGSGSGCSDVNLFDGRAPLAPGGSNTASITITNTGRTRLGTMALVAGRCTGSPSVAGRSLCSYFSVTLRERGSSRPFAVDDRLSLAALARAPRSLRPPVRPGSRVTYRLTITLSRAVPDALMRGTVSDPISWVAEP